MKTRQVNIRLDKRIVDEVAAMAEAMSQPGIRITPSDVLRAAILRGLKELRTPRR